MDDIGTSIAGGLSQADRWLAIDSALGPGALLMTRLEGEDAISRCFLYRIEVVATVPDDSVEALLGEPVTLWFMSDGPDTRRPIHGHVRSVAGLGYDTHGHRRFELEVVPRLWFLSCTCDCRIFQDLSVPDILRTVFTEQGLLNVAFRVVQDGYPKVDYCVQYEESALDFVSRLMEHLGLFYWHEHTADRHVLVIGDRNDATGRCDPPSVSLSANRQTGEIQTLDFRSVFRPGKWTLNDYDFESPTKRLLVNTATTLDVPRMRSHEIYRWAGEFTQHDDGRTLSRIRMEMEEARHRVVSGTGHCAGFDPGRRVSIATARNDPAKNYLLTEVRHLATSPGLESNADDPGNTYSNEFVAILATTPFRPPLVTPKPVMRGAQTATVVGPPGQNIFCDPFGRVRVRFHWDRLGQRNERSSCWMRVSQTRAGSFYGSLVIPHVGHEMIVSFLEGDPDRPLITGSVSNALTMPPVELPFDKDKTIQRDHGDNRMIMQGKPGQEHLSLVSPRRINMFSARQGARPLSAYGLPTTFSDNVNQFDGLTIDPFHDGDGLYEVWESWFLLNNPYSGTGPVPQIPNQNGSGTTDATTIENPGTSDPSWGSSGGDLLKLGSPIPTQNTTGQWKVSTGVAMTADTCDINSFTTGRNNAVSLDNKNTWVWKDNNTWVNGYSYTHVIQDTHSEVNGSTYSTVHGDTQAQIDGNTDSHVNGDTQSTVGGRSTSTIHGGSISWVFDDAVSGVFGDRTTFTIGANETAVLGANLTINVGFTSNIKLTVYQDYNGDTKLSTALTKIEQAVSKVESTITKIVDEVTTICDWGVVLAAAELMLLGS
ncbi:MAG TPA: type VI secretion system tip protein TssI/VgrG [Acetobacteraceae bacterium]|nr:type VI secretion system tip protein TssI/VgrG [Acetobacteraceae bacterium]